MTQFFSGLGWAPDQWLPLGHWAYVPEIAGIHSYNPEKAKELLAEAGYPNGFTTKSQYSSNPEYDQVWQLIQAYYKDIGVTLDLYPMTSAELRPIWSGGGSWDGLIFSGPPPYPDASDGFRSRFSGGDKYYTEMLVPDDYKEAVHNAVTAGSWEDKVKYTKEANTIFTEKAIGLYYYHTPKAYLSQPYLHDSGIFEVATDSQYTPENTWVELPKTPLK